MSCLSVIIRRVGSFIASLTRGDGGIVTTVERIGGISNEVERVGGIHTSITRVGGITCRMGLVCSTGLGDYVLWATDGRVLNVLGDYIYITKKG